MAQNQLGIIIDESDLLVEPKSFTAAYGESLATTLDIDTWSIGGDLEGLYQRIEEQVEEAVKIENTNREIIRREFLTRLGKRPNAPPGGGWYKVKPEQLKHIHSSLLFNGAVEACDGISVVHNTLPLSITQIGVCLVSYYGQHGSYVHRLFRRDLRLRGEDPVKEEFEMLERRSGRESVGVEDKNAALSNLARRGIMAYAERAILNEKSTANWKLGHGSPIPYELTTGFWASRPEMTDNALNLMRRMILEHQKFVYVPSAPKKRDLLTLGNALHPLEYLILYTMEQDLSFMLEKGGYRGEIRKRVEDFIREVGSQVVIGLYKASAAAPPNIFYAHRDHVQTAALIAMSDSVLQFHRGFPMLIDIADHLCKSTFGQNDFIASVQQAYSESGKPTQYLGERETRF